MYRIGTVDEETEMTLEGRTSIRLAREDLEGCVMITLVEPDVLS